MNQYPAGLVPMMIQQQYMMMPGALGMGRQGMAGVGVAASYSALNPRGAASQPSSGSRTQHHETSSQHPSSRQSQHRQQSPPSRQQPGRGQDFRRKDNDRSDRYGRQSGNRWQNETDVGLDEPDLDESLVVLDHFNSDLHLVIDPDGYGATVLNDPSGFCFTWAGARATYGVCRGKVFYEVHVLEHLPVDFGDDHQETDPHIVRLGWSIDSSSFQLGEEPWSYGYGGTGKFSTNNRFTDYGVKFEEGDVIGAMLDLDSRPPTISFMKNGTWYGVATPLHGYRVGNKEMALFPHILSKNCRFKVNFGQQDAWFPPPTGFRYIGHLPLTERVRGMTPPATKSDCEMIMIVGLPGAGKTTWGINMQKNHPDKRYNIIGTDTLIEKMRVMGLPRKRNYHGRWDVLIDKATKCLNKLFTIAAKRRRNYILDQTNVYASARRRKMKGFFGFYRIAAVIQPDDPELERRSKKRTVEDGKVVPESAVLEMKANYSVPEERDSLFDRVDFVELKRDIVQDMIKIYNEEGKTKPREDGGPPNRFDGNRKHGEQRQQQYGSQGYGRSNSYNKDSSFGKRDHYPDKDEIAAKRSKQDPDLLKNEDRQPRSQQRTSGARTGWSDPVKIKEEPGFSVSSSQWPSASVPPDYQDKDASRGFVDDSAYHRGDFPPRGMPRPSKSEYAGRDQLSNRAEDQDLYGYESAGRDSGRNTWQQPAEQGMAPYDRFGQQQLPSWKQEQEDMSKPQVRPWEQERSSYNSWQSDSRGRRDGGDYDRRGNGNRDYSRSDFRDRDRDRDWDRDRERDWGRDRERDRDSSRDIDYSYNIDGSRRGFGAGDRNRGDVGYNLDSGSSWDNQNFGSQYQDYGSEPIKTDRQRRRKSKWDQPGDEQFTNSDQMEQNFDLNRPPPLAMGDIKTEFPDDSNAPEIKLPPVGNSGDGLLGEGPGPKPLIPGLTGSMYGQFKTEGTSSGQLPYRQKGRNDSFSSRSNDNFSDNRRKNTYSQDNIRDEDYAQQQGLEPLVKLEEESTELFDKGSAGGYGSQSRGELGYGSEDINPMKGQPFRQRGPPGVVDRFPGPPDGPPQSGMFGQGPPYSNLGPRPPRGGPRGPTPYDGPPYGPRGPGSWNENRPRFGPRGPHGPPRPLFDDSLQGRWPRGPQ